MSISYDPEANAAYLALKEDATVSKTVEVTSSVLIDFDSASVPLGVELLYPARQLPLKELSKVLDPATLKEVQALWKSLREVLNKVENRKRIG